LTGFINEELFFRFPSEFMRYYKLKYNEYPKYSSGEYCIERPDSILEFYKDGAIIKISVKHKDILEQSFASKVKEVIKKFF
jgi:hypothetical protein